MKENNTPLPAANQDAAKATEARNEIEELCRLGFDTARVAYEQLGGLIAVIDAIAEIAEDKHLTTIANLAKLGQECGGNYRSSMFDFKYQFDCEMKKVLGGVKCG